MSKVIEYNNFLKNYMKDFDEKNIIIYGNNNCGKTYLLKEIFKMCKE